MMHIVCYLRDGDRVFETYWTTIRGVEVMDYNYALMDLTVYGRQEPWEDSPPDRPQPWQLDGAGAIRTNGLTSSAPAPRSSPGSRPIAQWARLNAGRSDDVSDPSQNCRTEFHLSLWIFISTQYQCNAVMSWRATAIDLVDDPPVDVESPPSTWIIHLPDWVPSVPTELAARSPSPLIVTGASPPPS
jgi:hypothetical protein